MSKTFTLKRRICQVYNDNLAKKLKLDQQLKTIDISTMFLGNHYEMFARQPVSDFEWILYDECLKDFNYLNSMEDPLYCRQVLCQYQHTISQNDEYDLEYCLSYNK